jgi:peroxiredoxin
MLAAGSKAPDFTLQDSSGTKFALHDALNRGPVLLAFYKISCPVCQLTMPFLERIAKGPLQVIAISQNDARGTARFQQTYGLTMPTLLDTELDGYPVSNAFGITHVPSLFLIETDGSISLATDGFVKRELERIARRADLAMFGPDDHVPEWKAG